MIAIGVGLVILYALAGIFDDHYGMPKLMLRGFAFGESIGWGLLVAGFFMWLWRVFP